VPIFTLKFAAQMNPLSHSYAHTHTYTGQNGTIELGVLVAAVERAAAGLGVTRKCHEGDVGCKGDGTSGAGRASDSLAGDGMLQIEGEETLSATDVTLLLRWGAGGFTC